MGLLQVLPQAKSFKSVISQGRLLVLFALGILWLLPDYGIGVDLCPFHLLTGLYCPLCGLTRSVISALHFNFELSFLYHPLGLPLLFVMILYITNVQVILDSWRYRFEPISKFEGTHPLYIPLVFLIVWFARLLTNTSV